MTKPTNIFNTVLMDSDFNFTKEDLERDGFKNDIHLNEAIQLYTCCVLNGLSKNIRYKDSFELTKKHICYYITKVKKQESLCFEVKDKKDKSIKHHFLFLKTKEEIAEAVVTLSKQFEGNIIFGLDI